MSRFTLPNVSKSGGDFKLKFDGDFHEIDADILVTNLLQTTTIVRDVNARLGSGKKIQVKVKALEQGSFLVHLELLAPENTNAIRHLFSRETIELITEIITIVGGVYGLHKFLAGKKAKRIEPSADTVVITNFNGDVLEIDKTILEMYKSSPVIKAALERNFENLDSDPTITGFELSDSEGNELVRIEKSEFQNLGAGSEDLNENEQLIIERTNLTVVRVAFEPKLKWDFYYRGIKIPARIGAADFINLIENGESFSKGDVFDADLEIHQEFDHSVSAYYNKSYKVLKVRNHIRRAPQQHFDFENPE